MTVYQRLIRDHVLFAQLGLCGPFEMPWRRWHEQLETGGYSEPLCSCLANG
jgi:hypothetical protein